MARPASGLRATAAASTRSIAALSLDKPLGLSSRFLPCHTSALVCCRARRDSTSFGTGSSWLDISRLSQGGSLALSWSRKCTALDFTARPASSSSSSSSSSSGPELQRLLIRHNSAGASLWGSRSLVPLVLGGPQLVHIHPRRHGLLGSSRGSWFVSSIALHWLQELPAW